MANLSHIISGHKAESVLRLVGDVAERLDIEAYAVGGIVRDLLLSRPTSDIDFVTVGAGTGIQLANEVAAELGTVTANVYPNFGTAAVRLPGATNADINTIEFVAARRESYRKNSRKPIVEDGTLEDDQLRRDFTINAMAIHVRPGCFGDLIDPFGGIQHLNAKRLVTPRDPHVTFEDDPLRIIRAARFATQLGFQIDEATFAAMAAQANGVKILSRERINDELHKIVAAPVPSIGFKILYHTHVLELIFAELVALAGVETVDGQAHKDNFFHTLQVLDNLAAVTEDRGEATLWLRWAALLHDIAKPRTKRFTRGEGWSFHGHEDLGARMVPKLFRKYRLPMDDRMRYVRKMVRLHHRPVSLVDETVTDSAVRRLLFDAGEDIDDLMTLVRADITSKNPRRVRRYLQAFDAVEAKMVEVEEKDRLRNFQPPVDGLEIMRALDLPPGRIVGKLKEAIREAILEGRVPNEHDAAFAYLMEIKDDLMDKPNDTNVAERPAGRG